MRGKAFAAALLLAALRVVPAGAAEERPWAEVKCERYRQAWAFTLEKRGRAGISQDFIDRHEAFLASGCTTQGHVCPRSPEELALADVMIITAMNFGTASTFPPFGCKP